MKLINETNSTISPTESNKESKTQKSDSVINTSDHIRNDTILKITNLDNRAIQKEVVISEDDKNRFLECLVTGDRYTEPFSIFNGKLIGKIRNRTEAETEAIFSYATYMSRNGLITNDVQFGANLRVMLLTAQIEELNGVRYEPLSKPLTYTENKNGVIPPGWAEDSEIWRGKSDAVVMALAAKIAEFETKYWEMVNNSSNENFWKPASSTES